MSGGSRTARRAGGLGREAVDAFRSLDIFDRASATTGPVLELHANS